MMKITELNLFRTRSSDLNIIHRQILTTRLFLLLFTIAFLILLTYSSINERAQSRIIQQPSLATFQRLIRRYPNTLQCPCQQISILSRHFVTTSSFFHQVCSSDFISQVWIDFTFGANIESIYPMDVRTFLSAMWQIIANLCRSANDAINDALIDFANEPFISLQVSSPAFLEAQIQFRLENTRRSANERFTRILMTIQTITQINSFMAGIMTNFFGTLYSNLSANTFPMGATIVEQKYVRFENNEVCRCHRDQSCQMPGGFYAYHSSNYYENDNLDYLIANTTVPGIMFDCLPILATFASSLECFYNRSCIDLLQHIYRKSINVSILNRTKSSRFPSTVSLKQIIEELFIEEIVSNISFSAYYNQCAPISCTYTYFQRFDWIFVTTKLVGLAGGLNAALRLITPYLIELVFFVKSKLCRRRDDGTVVNNDNQKESIWRKMWIKMKLTVIELNIFYNDRNYQIDHRQGRLATRVYLLLMTVLLPTLIIYTYRSIQTLNITLKSPSQQQYEYIEQFNPDNLQCPCSNISIPYGDFLKITVTYHQLCSSDFVQTSWYRNLEYLLPLLDFIQFETLSSSYFEALAFFCSLANNTFNAAYDRLLSTTFVHREVISRLSFFKQTDILIERFMNATRSEFMYTISLINDILNVDQYVSGSMTNTYFRTNYADEQSTPSPYRLYPLFRTYNNMPEHMCNCGTTRDCALINDSVTAYLQPTGISVRCSMLGTTLKSSLACWFDYQCLALYSLFMFFWSSYPQKNATLLNTTKPSRFSVNATVESIVTELMIEYHNTSVNYEQYYEKCQPLSCTYTRDRKNNLIYVVTTMIGLFGGLNVALHLISPLLVKLYLGRRRRNIRIAVVNTIPDDQQSLQDNPQCYFRWKNRLQQLNLFATGSIDINILRQERMSTRLFLFLLLISISIIIIYTVTPNNIMIKTIDSPSLTEYQQLLVQHNSSLNCPCDQISIPHQDLLTIAVTYHQICTSDLIDPAWISYLSNGSSSLLQVHDDFRVIVGVYFRMLSTLCAHAQAVVDKMIDEFFTKTFLSSSVIFESKFLSRMHDVTSQFQESAASGFSDMIQLLRGYLHGNTFISSYNLNWYAWTTNISTGAPLFTSPYIFNDGCSCGTRSDCVTSQPFLLTIPGFVMGCSVIEGVMRSSLISLYSQTLLDNITASIHRDSSRIFHIKSLNASLKSRYMIDTTIHDLTNNLFVEKWSFNISYQSFYNQCTPSYCSYVLEKRNNAFFALSRLLAFYGGLTVSCRFFVPYIIRIWMRGVAYFLHRHVVPL